MVINIIKILKSTISIFIAPLIQPSGSPIDQSMIAKIDAILAEEPPDSPTSSDYFSSVHPSKYIHKYKIIDFHGYGLDLHCAKLWTLILYIFRPSS